MKTSTGTATKLWKRNAVVAVVLLFEALGAQLRLLAEMERFSIKNVL